MKKKILIVIGSILAVAILFVGVRVTTAYAQKGTLPAFTIGQFRDGHGMGQAELDAAAKVLKMTAADLSTALNGGKTLADLATTAGVDIKDVQVAITAAHTAEMRTRIQAGVTDGSISQDKANWLLEGLDKGYLDGPGFGFGFRGPRGGPHDLQPVVQPTQTANP